MQRTTNTDFLVYFSIFNLFTNVTFDETTDIYADYLHRGLLKPPFLLSLFDLMKKANKTISA